MKPTKQPVPQRTTQRFTEGTGFAMRPTSTTATAPELGPVGKTPNYPYIFGVDFDEANQVAVSGLSSGTSTTITNTLSFPDITSLKLDPTDSAALVLVPQVYQNPIKPGLVIASVQVQPQAFSVILNAWVPAIALASSQVYSAWRAIFTIGLVAATATTATSLNVGAAATVVVFSR